MATNDDLDKFFQKKDRKGNKHKKQSGLLTNNQELLKQLEIVTSATSAFKENEFEYDDDDFQNNDEPTFNTHPVEEVRKNPSKSNKTKVPDTLKSTHESEIFGPTDGQDEWEDFESSSTKREQIRLKISRQNNDENYDDNDYYDDDANPNNNHDNNDTDRNQQKDKPAWKIGQLKENEEKNDSAIQEKPQEPAKPESKSVAAPSGAYRPPALRSGSSVTVVSGVNQRIRKKKEPNLASTEEFPMLQTTINKK